MPNAFAVLQLARLDGEWRVLDFVNKRSIGGSERPHAKPRTG